MNITLEKNSILKDGEEVGVYNPETNTVLSAKDIAPTVKGQITHLLTEEHKLTEKPSYDVAPENEEKPKTKAKKEEKRDRLDLQNKRDGDLTYAYVEWYRENHTAEEFEAKYAGRKYATEPEMDGETNYAKA